MLPKKVEKILNEQVEKEGYSSHIYLAMASWAENNGLPGIAEWLYAQSEEERKHMLKLIHYINERDSKAVIPQFKLPPAKVAGVKELFDQILEHEQYISKSINEIVAVCEEVKDYTTNNWIQWFVKEQIEEEATARAIIDKLKLLGNLGLYILDSEIMKLRSNS